MKPDFTTLSIFTTQSPNFLGSSRKFGDRVVNILQIFRSTPSLGHQIPSPFASSRIWLLQLSPFLPVSSLLSSNPYVPPATATTDGSSLWQKPLRDLFIVFPFSLSWTYSNYALSLQFSPESAFIRLLMTFQLLNLVANSQSPSYLTTKSICHIWSLPPP